MTATKKMTMRILAEEFEKLKEEVIELRPLKQKVADLKEKFEKAMSDKIVNTEEESSGMLSKCKKCGRSFESVRELKKRHKEKHPGEKKCVICSERFAKNSDLETHIKSLHTEKEG